MTDTLQLSTNIGTGDTLSVNDLAGGEKCQNIKILSAADASEVEIHAAGGLAANALRVELPTDGTGQVKLAAGTASAGTVGLNTGTNSVGTVGLDAGTNAIGTVKSQGGIAHDAAYSENPLPIAGYAVAQDGTSPGTAVAEADVTRLKADLDGLLFVNQTHPYNFSVSADYGSAQTNTTIQAAVASVSINITDICISNGAVAGNVTLLDGSGGTVLFEVYLAVNSMAVVSLRNAIRLTSNTLLAITSTSCTTHAVNISGFYAA